jgi:hypothetical protein
MCAALILLSSDTEGSAATTAKTVRNQRVPCGKQKVTSSSEGLGNGDGNTKPQNDCQPNWNSLKVMALIHAKEKEHEVSKLTTDARENRIAHDIGKARFSNFYRGPIACKDKWQPLFGERQKN